MSDVDIVLEVATKGIENIYNLSNAMKQVNAALVGAANPMKALDARARALNIAVGATDSSLKNHAKTLQQLARNQSVISSEMGRVRKELDSLSKGYAIAGAASAKYADVAIRDLRNYDKALKSVKFGSLIADLKSISVEQKRLGKDAQFVGRSLIIGLTTPIMGFARYGLQALVGIDREFVRLNKVLENIAPNLDSAATKMGVDLKNATDSQLKSLQQLVDNYNKLDQSLTGISSKFGTSKELVISLAGEFAELGVQSAEGIAKITELTTATEKLGNMDIGNARQLVQSLYFQALRAMQQSGESRNMTSLQRETTAIAAAKSQLAMFNAVENTTALTLKDLGDAFPEVAAAATTFGMSMTEAAALLAPMKAAGMDIGASANSIKISLQSIVAPTAKTEKMFASLTDQFGDHFKLIKGTGLEAIQSLIDAYNTLANNPATGQEGVLQFFTQIFGKRQATRMLVGVQQMAEFDSVLKDTGASADLAEKQLQSMANTAIVSANKAQNVNLPLIDSYRSIGIIARIATSQAGNAVEGFSKHVSQAQIDAAIKVRDQISKGIFEKSQKQGIDLIGSVATESGRAMFVELAGVENAQAVADRELNTSLKSLDVTMQRMKNNFKMFASDLLKAIRPALEKVAAFVQRLYEAWTKLDPATKSAISKLVVGIGGLTAAIGPVIFMFGQFRLAMGSVASVIFSFIPHVKTMTVEMVAASEKMLNLSKPLTVMGETVVNNSGKFATFIATLASGKGPLATFAEKMGYVTGVLQRQTTASQALTTSIYEMKAAREVAGGIPTLPGETLSITDRLLAPLRGRGFAGRTTGEVEESLRKRVLREAGMGGVAKGKLTPRGIREGIIKDLVRGSGYAVPTGAPTFANLYADIAQQKFEALGLGTRTGRRPTPGGGPGIFTRKTADILAEAEDLQARGFTSAGRRGPGGRFMTRAVRDALKALEDAQDEVITHMNSASTMAVDVVKDARTRADAAFARAKSLREKGVDFDPLTGKGLLKGRTLSEERLASIESGGLRGIFARTAEGGARFKARSLLFGQKGLEGTEKISGTFLGGATTFAAIKGGVKGIAEFVKSPVKGIKDIGTATTSIGPKLLGVIKNPSTILPKFIGLFSKLGGVITGLLPLLSSLGTALSFTGVGAAIVAVIAIVIILVKHWREFMKAIQPGIKAFKDAFNIIKDGAMAAIKPIGDLFTTFTNDGNLASSVIKALGYSFNFVAEVVKFVAKIIGWLLKTVIGGAFSMALKPIVALIKGVISFISGIVEIFHGNFSKGFHKIIDGIGKAIIGLMGPFAGLFSGLLKIIAKVFSALSHIPLIGGAYKKGAEALRAVAGYIDKTREMGKKAAETQAKKTAPDPNTQPMQEKIAKAVKGGIETGVDKSKNALNKLNKKLSTELKNEIQNDIADRIKTTIGNVVDALVEGLKTQKESSLKIYDDQLKKIDDTAKAEERLTKTKEYENKKRELEERRALDRLNANRSYNLAIYEGRIDDARTIALESQKAEMDGQKEMANLESDRRKELADQRREDLVNSIKDARDIASKYYDDMITAFINAAKGITEFPPTTAAKFNEQLVALTDKAKEFASNMGAKTTEGFTGALSSLGVDASAPLISALGTIGDVLVKNSPFGPDGVWQKTIDASLDGLKKKYEGLTDTLTMVIDKNSEKFKSLFEVYKNYKELVAKNEAELAGTSGGGGGGTGGSATTKGGSIGQTGLDYNPGWYYHYKEKGQKFWSPWQGPLDKATVERLRPTFEKIGLFSAQFSNYNPGTTTFGSSQGTAANALYERNAFAIGGVIPYGKGGPTKGPVQEGIPAILHGGEYVVRNSAVKKYGWGMMQQINQGTYKPKPFAVGGMIDRRRILKNTALNEWNWQQSQGGATEAYLNANATTESGDAWTGKQPEWNTRVKTSHGWMGGGLRIADTTWEDYGGLQFAPTADQASKLAQMVVKNRIALFGYKRGNRILKPTGWGGSVFAAGLENYVKPLLARPEFFNPNLDILSQITRNRQDFTTATSGSGYATEEGAKFFTEYFTKKPKEASRISLYGKNPFWIKGEGSTAKKIKTPKGFDDGGLVPNAADLKVLPQELNFYPDAPNIGPVNPYYLLKTGGLIEFAKGGIVDESRNNAVGLKNIIQQKKKKRGWFGDLVDNISDVVRVPLNAVKSLAQGFGMGAALPAELAMAEIGAIANYIPGIGHSNKKGSLVNQFISSPFEQTTFQKFINAVGRGMRSKEKVGLNELMGLKGFAGFFPKKKYFEEAQIEAAQNRPILGKGTAFTPGGILAYYGLNKVVGGILNEATGNKPEWAKEGSAAYGLTKVGGDIAGTMALDPMIGPSGVKSLLTSPYRIGKKIPNYQEYLDKFYEFLVPMKKITTMYGFESIDRGYEAKKLVEHINAVKAKAAMDAEIRQKILAGKELHINWMRARNAAKMRLGAANPLAPNADPIFSILSDAEFAHTPLKAELGSVLGETWPSFVWSRFAMHNLGIGETISETDKYIKQSGEIFAQLKIPQAYLTRLPEWYQWLIQEALSGGHEANVHGLSPHIGGFIDLNEALTVLNQGMPFKRTLFRGIFDDKGLYKDLKPGDLISHLSPIRTSTNIETPRGFSGSAHGAPNSLLMAIDVPVHTPYYADPSRYPGEMEVILRGGTLRVDKFGKVSDNSRLLRATLVDALNPLNFDISKYKKIGPGLGWNAGGFYEDLAGAKYYIKEAPTAAAAINETLATRLYEYFKVNTLGQRYVRGVDGKHYIISKFNESLMKIENYKDQIGYFPVDEIAKKYIIDALLGNYDAIGPMMDNTQFLRDTYGNYHPVMADAGAALLHRGTGGLKSARQGIQFGDIVEEIDALLMGTYDNHQSFARSAEFYNLIGTDKMQRKIRSQFYDFDRGLSYVNWDMIKRIIDAAGIEKPNDLYRTIEKRFLYLKNRMIDSTPFGEYNPRRFNGGYIPKGFANGGIVPSFDSMAVPAILHGGEYVINSKAVKNIGFAALEAMNHMRFQTPKAPSYSGPVSGQATSSSTVHIYVDNFIGEKAWFESMMKDYNINVSPQNQKAAGLQNRTITTYNGLNRGL